MALRQTSNLHSAAVNHYFRAFGFSRLSAKFLGVVFPCTLLCIGGACYFFGDNLALAHRITFLVTAFSLMLSGSAAGLMLGLIGWLRKDEAPRLGLLCSAAHAALLVVCFISFFVIAVKDVQFRLGSAPAGPAPSLLLASAAAGPSREF